LHVELDGDRVRLITRNGYDRTSRGGIANKF
jgi:ATP-dependent DNA ligase